MSRMKRENARARSRIRAHIFASVRIKTGARAYTFETRRRVYGRYSSVSGAGVTCLVIRVGRGRGALEPPVGRSRRGRCTCVALSLSLRNRTRNSGPEPNRELGA